MKRHLSHSETFSSQLIEWIRGKSPILIVTHDHPDPDALASSYALRHLFLVKTGQEATIAFGGRIGRGENKEMVKRLEVPTVSIDELDLNDFNVICMVDCQPGTGNNSIPADVKVDLVIDHHALRGETEACRWVDVRPDYGAAASILFEYLVAQDVNIATKLATLLFYAIKSETQSLGRDWTKADREAYLQLVPLSNNRILYDITHPKSPRAYFSYFDSGLKNARIFDDLLVFNLYQVDHPEIVAEIADFLMRTEGVNLVLGIGCYQGEGVLSLRTSTPETRAGVLIRTITADLGTAGGHGMTAGGQIRPMPSSEAGQLELEELLVSRLFEALERELPEPKPLVDL
ncbi:MAG: DHH family phosphoesterase [Desulfuromonadales bacterium]|nr:DHH family phosphoesterase [Desulfuromonadales bacterium]